MVVQTSLQFRSVRLPTRDRRGVSGRSRSGRTSLAEDLADNLLRNVGLPTRARADALHIALAAAQGMDYLVTWNVTHLANALIRPRVERACRLLGYEPPVLSTPDELLAGEDINA